jgi:hypothetical protein
VITFKLSPQMEAALRKLGKFPHAVEKALDDGVAVVEPEGKAQSAKIKAKPPARSKTGRERWKQTGTLAASQQTQRRPGQRTVLWAAKHAQPRFGLWIDRIPKNPADGVRRENNVAQDTATAAGPKVGPAVEASLTKSLND